MDEPKKKGVLSFEEGMKEFTHFGNGKGLWHSREIGVDVLLDGKDIGYITDDGKITIRGDVTRRDPVTMMSYSVSFTVAQWDAIGARASEFREKSVRREAKFAPAFKKLEELARSKFFEGDALFRHIKLAKIGKRCVIVGGGKGEYETHIPGLYIYDEEVGETVKVGYRSCSEQRVTGASFLEDAMLEELIKVAETRHSFVVE